ncbi:MAG: FAD-dependent oxidoreductase [Desulfobacterales bacterium]
MSTRTSADVVVIGGGVVGTAVTYFLARNHVDVLLVDKGAIAGGTSGRCGGNVLLIDKVPGFDCQLTQLSQNLFPEISEELDYPIEWIQKGSLLAIENEAEMEVAIDFCQKLAGEGVPVRILDRHEVHDDAPRLADDVVGGMECDSDGLLNPMALAHGLTDGAKKAGAKIQNFSPVIDIGLDPNGRIEKVVTERGEILTRQVVNAAGIWAPEIGKQVGLEIPITPRQGQLLVAERTFPVARRKVMEFGYMMAKFESSDYKRDVTPEMEAYGVAMVFEPTQAGNFHIGSSRRFVGMDTACHIDVLRAIAKRAIRFFPVIKHIKFIRSYAGLRPFTPDHLPIISATDIPGFYVAAGHEGNGIGLSLITGKLIAQIICREPLAISVDPLKLSRFKDKQKE